MTADDSRREQVAARCEAARAGAVEAVVAAMNAHQHSFDLQRDAAGVLWNLGAPSPELADILARMATAGAAAAVLRALRTFCSLPALCQKACAALQNMAGLPAIRAGIGRDGVEAVTVVLSAHGDSAEVQQYALAALGRIVHEDADLQRHAIASGAHTAAVAAMRTHGAHVNLQRFACNTLQNLTQNAVENRQVVADIGAIDVVLTAMRNHPSAQALQESGAGALLNIGWGSPRIQAIIGPAANSLIQRAQSTFPHSEKLVSRGAPVLTWAP
jgi:hypothetical protein